MKILIIFLIGCWIMSAIFNGVLFNMTRHIERRQETTAQDLKRVEREQQRQAEQLERHEKCLEKLYFRIEKCEDEIAHFTELSERLTAQRDEMQAEINSITARLEHADGTLDPLNASLDSRFAESDGAILYMDMYASTLDQSKTKKQKQESAEKLIKRRDTLKSKVIQLDNRIFAAEQKVKKATFEREQAQEAIG